MLTGSLYSFVLGLFVFVFIMRSRRVFLNVNWCGVMSQRLSRNCGTAVSNVAPQRQWSPHDCTPLVNVPDVLGA